jgi:hypothetical protein
MLMLIASGAFASIPAGPHQQPPCPNMGPPSAPEIDPSSALSALTLLAGGLAVMRGRLRR